MHKGVEKVGIGLCSYVGKEHSMHDAERKADVNVLGKQGLACWRKKKKVVRVAGSRVRK